MFPAAVRHLFVLSTFIPMTRSFFLLLAVFLCATFGVVDCADVKCKFVTECEACPDLTAPGCATTGHRIKLRCDSILLNTTDIPLERKQDVIDRHSTWKYVYRSCGDESATGSRSFFLFETFWLVVFAVSGHHVWKKKSHHYEQLDRVRQLPV